MQTYIYYVAEKLPGALEMQRFAHPIHVGLVTAENHVEAYTSVLENLRPTFADEPQPLEVRFEVVMPPRAGEGVWRHGKPIDTDITFGSEDCAGARCRSRAPAARLPAFAKPCNPRAAR